VNKDVLFHWQKLDWLLVLHPWEEYIGTLIDSIEKDGERYLVFESGKAVRIPVHYEATVAEMKGKKVSILATDLCGKEVLIKKVGETDE